MAHADGSERANVPAPPSRWADWVGRHETNEDILTGGLVEGLLATLDRTPDPAAAPQGVHWLCAPPRVRGSRLAADGHPTTGDFLPPVDLPRRMWASSRMDFLAPMTPGCHVTRASTIAAVSEKAGASGRLVFVEVEHLISADHAPAVREVQTIVYREAPSGALVLAKTSKAPEHWTWTAHWPTNPVLLFRYSALTFNGHRIHYDLPYATEVEGYSGLVVHGPLMATLMLDLCERHLGPSPLASFSFRGLGPAFCGETLVVGARRAGDRIDLGISTEDGRAVMTGQAEVSPNARP